MQGLVRGQARIEALRRLWRSARGQRASRLLRVVPCPICGRGGRVTVALERGVYGVVCGCGARLRLGAFDVERMN